MEVTREVINDLLPVYLAGEASGDTKALVEQFLTRDPELAALAKDDGVAQLLKHPVAFDPSGEKQILKRLKRLIRIQTWFMAAAILFSLVPLSIRIADGSLTFFMLRDTPWLAVIYWVIAIVFWLGYFVIRRRLRVSGL